MDKKPTKQPLLRAIAEAQLARAPATDNLVHELQVHQIELEMQNEELRRAHLALEHSRDRYLDLYDFAPVGYFTLTNEGVIVEANLTGATLLGVERDKLYRHRFASFITEDGSVPWRMFLAAVRRGEEQSCALTLRLSEGPVCHVRVDGRHLAAKGDTPAMVRITLTDFSPQKRAEGTINSQKVFIETMLENIQDGIVACDENGRLSLFNRATRDFHGIDKKNLPPEQWADHYDLYLADGITPMPMAEIPLWRAFAGQTVSNQEMVIAPKTGIKRTLLASGRAFYGLGGEKLGAVVSMHDITQQKLASEALRLSESRFRGAFETAAHGMALISPQGRFLQVNQAMCAIVGYEMGELLATDFQSLTHPDDLERCLAYIHQMLAGTIPTFHQEKRYIHKQGHLIWVFISVSLVWDGSGQPLHFVSHLQDITARKIAEAELLAAKGQLELQVACINRIQSLFIEESHADTLFDTLLLEVLRLTGSTMGFIAVEKRDERDHPCLHPLATCHMAPDEITSAFYGGAVPGADGTPGGGGHPPIADFLGVPITRGQESLGVLGLANRPHGYDTAVMDYLRPVLSSCAQIITGYHNREKRLEMKELLRKSKEKAEAATQAKSDFLSAMSHEIRSPLNVVLGMGDILGETDLTEEQRHYTKMMHQAGEALMGIINNVLDFSRIEAGKLILVDLDFSPHAVVEEASRSMQLFAQRKGLALVAEVLDGVPLTMTGDAGRIRQVLVNLIGNAIKFTEQGHIKVCLAPHPQDAASLLFTVTDTGIGIAPQDLNRVFERFTQADAGTSRRYGGTGLGLSISRELVALMGGRLWVESQVGQGSTFAFTLLLNTVAEQSSAIVPEETATRSLRILLVENSYDNQILFQIHINKTPHRLVIVDNGAEAVRMVGEERFDLVFMDVQMPVMDGYATTRLIRQWELATSRQPLPIVALTAQALTVDAERGRAAGCDRYLTKPINRQRLLEVIQQMGTVQAGKAL